MGSRDPELMLKAIAERSPAHVDTGHQACAALCLCDWYIAKAKMHMCTDDISNITDKMLRSLEWAMETRLHTSGWQHPATWGAILCTVVAQQLRSPHSQKVQALVGRVISAQAAVLGPEHEHVMLSQQVQAHLLLQQRNFAEARRLVAKSYQHLIQSRSKAADYYHLCIATAANLSAMRHSKKATMCLMMAVNAVSSTCNIQLFQICVQVLAAALLELDQLEEVEALMLFVLQWGRKHASMDQMMSLHWSRSAMTPADLICWLVAKFPSTAWEPWHVMSSAYLRAQLFDQAIATASLVKPESALVHAEARITIAEAKFLKGDSQGAESTCAALQKCDFLTPDVHAKVLLLNARMHAHHGRWKEAQMTLESVDTRCYAHIEPSLTAQILYLRSTCFNKLGQGKLGGELLYASAMVGS
eukprot:jgi/Ulvmu1/9764/UM056_0004.1